MDTTAATSRLIKIQAWHLSVPLSQPYALSFTMLDSFEAILVNLLDSDGTEWWSESVPLPGYSTEDFGEVWNNIKIWSKDLIGKSAHQALDIMSDRCVAFPFSCAALATALEIDISHHTAPLRIPLVATILSRTVQDIGPEIERLLERGYRTFKLKIGWEPTDDLKHLRAVQKELLPGCCLRIDANQGYSLNQAIRFAEQLDPTQIQLIEQPFPTDKWEWMEELGRHTPVPLMLDESITDECSVRRAASIQGVAFVKFKLSKAGSVSRLRRLIDVARSSDLDVIVGNGVATDVGCCLEAMAVADRINLAGEMNGFSKTVEPLLYPKLDIKDGVMLLEHPNERNLNQEAVRRWCRDSFIIS